jgi:23S rRNA pseudouridine1911/1915/1917 synthase
MLDLEIIHENNEFIAINKAAGLISERSPYEECTVEVQVFNHLQKNRRNPYVGIIHRLDRVTSGVMILAKKKSVLVAFNGLFSERKVQKTYLAVVKNEPPKQSDTLVNFLVKNQIDKRADIVPTKTKESLDCSLSYQVLGKNEFGYLLEIKPTTGRFHQIRAQLAHIGLPIIGDEKYGSDQAYLPLSICLHAWKLTYPMFETEVSRTIEAPMPTNEHWKFDLDESQENLSQ